MQMLDGKLVSQTVKERLKEKISSITSLRPPHLAAVLIGGDGASETYVASKIKNCQEIGFGSSLIPLPKNISKEDLLEQIKLLNKNKDIDGILIQLPLPAHISESVVMEAIDPSKDVDGFHPTNAGKLLQGASTYIPATPYGIMLLLEHYKIDTAGKHAVIIGRSNIVGRPMSILLSQNTKYGNCTVTLCHSRSNNLKDICLGADIIVAAIGKPLFLKADMVKEGAIVIDVGINRIEDPAKKSGYRLLGDVDYDNVAPKCSYITPVPGGVGPMTIAAVLMNTFHAWERNFLHIIK